MGKLIDADHVKVFFFSETSGTEDVIRDLMDTHGLDYACLLYTSPSPRDRG